MIIDDINDPKKDMNEEKISPIIKNEYPIFKFMNEKGILDRELDYYDIYGENNSSDDNSNEYNNKNYDAHNAHDEYELFLRLYNELYPEKNKNNKNSSWVPHNYHYLSEKEKKKYKNIDKKYKNELEEFINNKTCPKKYPPLNKILDDLESEKESELMPNEASKNSKYNEKFNGELYDELNDELNDELSDELNNELNNELSEISDELEEIPKIKTFENFNNSEDKKKKEENNSVLKKIKTAINEKNN
jgi:hypothetical protein